MTEVLERYRRNIGRWRCATFSTALLCLVLLISLITMTILLNKKLMVEKEAAPNCGDGFQENIDTSEATDPGLYDDLTVLELKNIQDFLYARKDLKLVKPNKVALNSSYIYVSDLHPPRKSEALGFLKGTGPKPDRKARIIIFRGDVSDPLSVEYVVSPLPNPTKLELLKADGRRNPVPYAFRPAGDLEFRSYFTSLLPEVDRKIGFILRESFNATFMDCGDRCLMFFATPVGSGISRQIVRKVWLSICHNVEYYLLNSLDIRLLANINSSDPSDFFIEKLDYAGEQYMGLDDLANQYRNGSIPKAQTPFPEEIPKLKSSLHLRGDPVPKDNKRPPRMYEPDGKRYAVKHRKVEYMHWSFNFRLSTLSGPQLYDIRFKDERIAYEVGLQEIAVCYASNNSATRSADFVDSGVLIGTHSQSLVPGSDCPETSTFFNYAYLGETSEDPVLPERAFCLFEQNQGIPLRRHLSYSQFEGGFYSGLSDNVLILRSIYTIVNYDYIMDFIFHQSGAMDVRVLSTGYIFSSMFTPKESPYGFQIKKHTVASLHHHMFLFKADIDIRGESNRYETLDISRDVSPNHQTTGDPNAKYYQIRFDKNLKRTELDAAYKFNFDSPMYHVIHNNNHPTNTGEISAYRIQLNGMAKQLLPEDIGNEVNVAWARNQMTVTKFKHDERDASSIYGLFDSLEPTVNFTSFYADDDNIVDEDLVAWISMGVHHIPHTEDLPITPTPGGHLSFSLLPYNYFEECPSSSSRDSIRVEYKDKDHPERGAKVIRYNNPEMPHCMPKSPDYDKMVDRHASMALESSQVHDEEVHDN